MDHIIQSCAVNTVFICHSYVNKDRRGRAQRAKRPSGGWRGAKGPSRVHRLLPRVPSVLSPQWAAPHPTPSCSGTRCSWALLACCLHVRERVSPARPVAPGAQPVLPGCSRVTPPTLSPGRAPLSWEVTRSWEKVGPSTWTTFYMVRLGGFLWGGPADVGC